MPSLDVVLCHPVRTAIGAFNGTLKNTPATELGAIVVRETLRRAALDPARVGSVVLVEDLDRDAPLELAVARPEDARHAAGPDELLELVPL